MAYTFAELPVENIAPAPRNARTHSPAQISQIVSSIRKFGFTNPLLLDEGKVIIAGHGRMAAAKKLGLTSVPVILIEGLTEASKRALAIADNRIAENAGWDLDILAAELSAISELELDFDLEVTGFEAPEIDLLIGDGLAEEEPEPEEVELPDADVAEISRKGDIWILGNHRILCGDALVNESYVRLMGDERADVGFTDPPYNVPIHGHVCGGGEIRHREFAQASGEMSSQEFCKFLEAAFQHASEFSAKNAVWFACIDWRHIEEMRAAGLRAFGSWLNMCVWAKTNGGMGSLYRSQHELVFVFRNGRKSHRNNVQLGRFGRNRTNLWTYPGVNTFRKGRLEELRAHPTAKPVQMVSDALLDVSKRGDVVLDPFSGAGSTLIAAEKSGRFARSIEIDPAYVDTTLRRWRALTGCEPVRLSDGAEFSSLEAGFADAGEGQ
ncbi:ParB N-terminal domain-containing protein [Sulfitobacter sp. JBTF-M27]|uniref:Methyltransferase n=1 Tax=Sulfitobacter sediminilitoris TaxID=2698830 RepID=A0A6P0CKS9_9RHOB|nr:DNA methyltransferase [Sulfitobacter sediminilitoris]NEK25153.1 ParB N-terminal domain-containing protein [Sulfitobacter sediminilitoris]